MGLTSLLRRGLAAGAAAGLAAAIMLWLVVEPVLRQALKVEDARTAAETAAIVAKGGHIHEEEPLVSRALQVIGGMGTALVIGALFGVVFAVVFAKVRHRLPGASDYGRSLALATFGFGAFVLAPALKIPSNPPAVGNPESVDRRTLIYVLAVIIAVALIIAAFAFDEYLATKGLDGAVRTSLVVVGFVVAAGLAFAVTPGSPDTIASDMGAQIVWDFRVASLLQLATLWGVLGMVFGVLVTRKSAGTAAREPVSSGAA